jgi:transcriptional regulator with XRE-family HTH domain
MSAWAELRARRLAEPGAMEEYDAAKLAFELGAALRGLREERSWSQSSLAEEARTTQPVVARLEAGGALPTVPVLQRLARALEMRLEVRFRGAEEVGFRGAEEVGFQGAEEVRLQGTEGVSFLMTRRTNVTG